MVWATRRSSESYKLVWAETVVRPRCSGTATARTVGRFLGYATAWLEYQLSGNATAAGAHPELVSNTNWPGSATK